MSCTEAIRSACAFKPSVLVILADDAPDGRIVTCFRELSSRSVGFSVASIAGRVPAPHAEEFAGIRDVFRAQISLENAILLRGACYSSLIIILGPLGLSPLLTSQVFRYLQNRSWFALPMICPVHS